MRGELFGSPTAAQLIEAVREFLESLGDGNRHLPVRWSRPTSAATVRSERKDGSIPNGWRVTPLANGSVAVVP